DHVDAETRLEIALLVQLVQDDLRRGVAFDLNPDPHARAIGVVLNVGDALDLPLFDQARDLLDQAGLVHLVGDLGDDDRLAALRVLFDLAAGTTSDRTTAGEVGLADAVFAQDQAAGRKVGAFDDLEELAGV